MIVAKFEMDEKRHLAKLCIKGHAGMAPVGTDTICSAASILAYTLAQNIKIAESRGLLKYKPTLKLKEGDAIIAVRAKDDEAYAELLSIYLVIQTGYQLLSHNYPQYVALEMFGQAE